ncbi:AAA family ATPase [Pseudomonas sp. UBA6562]|uniref:AAA family ATPase n=1 Tax=Pseudomonas sp. UBA6562 TaxID=1947332 RepID=UPI0025CF3944|nr:AAA family ATPase [Pseudomonas sp. UBA6562]
MYLRKLELTNFRAFASLVWEIDAGEEPGWHVLIGPNGSGKSGFLRAGAIAFTGAIEFAAARRPAQEFIRRAPGVVKAVINVEVAPTADWDTSGKQGPQSLRIVKGGLSLQSDGLIKPTTSSTPKFLGDGRGWFSAAFGPMRRFSGGNPENVRLFTAFPRLARHLSIFNEDVALTEALEWLQRLRFKQLEGISSNTHDGLLGKVRTFINQPGFLPHGAELTEVNSETVKFVDGNNVDVPILELSDGYRAVLSMTFELLRLLVSRYSEAIFSKDACTVLAPGVVFIDEIDAHLHPSWQREIGPWLTRLFPAIQFIVTTHSPYVCQTAARGSVWRLPEPGAGEQLHRITGDQLNRVLYGDVLHVLNSEAFGGLPGRSDEAVDKLDRLAKLNRVMDRGTLSAPEVSERLKLESTLASVTEDESL